MKTVAEMAREAGFDVELTLHGERAYVDDIGITEQLERFAALVREDYAERIAILEQDNANCRKAVSDLMDKLNERENQQEPVAHMYPWDLARFQNEETFAQAFSIPVGCPDGRSVPLYTIPPATAPKKIVCPFCESEHVPAGLHDLNMDWVDNAKAQAARQMRDAAVKVIVNSDAINEFAASELAETIEALPIPDHFPDVTKKIEPPKLRRAGSFGE